MKKTNMQSISRHVTRQLLVQAIYKWQLTGVEYHELIKEFDSHFSGIDDIYFKEVLMNILNKYNALCDTQRKVSNIEPESQEMIVRTILLISTYELEYRKEIPYKVVLNEALELSKEYGSKESYKFVNGVLDKLAQECRPNESTR